MQLFAFGLVLFAALAASEECVVSGTLEDVNVSKLCCEYFGG